MRILMIIAAVFILLMTLALISAKHQGLHPNMFVWAVMIPFVVLFIWAKGTLHFTK